MARTTPLTSLRIWSERLPLPELRRPSVLRLLQPRGLGLHAAVRPDQLDEAARLALACAGEGVELHLWPMAGDAEGRWLSAANHEPFLAFVGELERALEGRPWAGLVLDLEPPFAFIDALTHGRATWPRPVAVQRAADAESALQRLVDRQHAAGREVSLAVIPLVALDRPALPPGIGWQGLLGTPVDSLGADLVSVMAYPSMVEGLSRGLLARPDVESLLAQWSAEVRVRWPGRAGLSLGVTGIGALGDEPVYRDISELQADVAIARAAGIQRLALFDLTGVLGRESPEAWLDAFVATPPRTTPTPSTLRARLVDHSLRALSTSARVATRLRPRGTP